MVEVRTRARFLSSQGAAASRKGLCPRTAAGWAAENISTVVVDIGHATSRFGFAGEDRPLQFPSVRGPVERAAWRGGITHARAAQAAGVLAGASRKRPSPSRRKGGQTGAAAGSAGAASAHESREARKFFVGDDALFLRRDHMQMNSHMEDGLGACTHGALRTVAAAVRAPLFLTAPVPRQSPTGIISSACSPTAFRRCCPRCRTSTH